jgi:hypothetical protein
MEPGDYHQLVLKTMDAWWWNPVDQCNLTGCVFVYAGTVSIYGFVM